jgi:hypothetical protein
MAAADAREEGPTRVRKPRGEVLLNFAFGNETQA